jgi:hypothetical protein
VAEQTEFGNTAAAATAAAAAVSSINEDVFALQKQAAVLQAGWLSAQTQQQAQSSKKKKSARFGGECVPAHQGARRLLPATTAVVGITLLSPAGALAVRHVLNACSRPRAL